MQCERKNLHNFYNKKNKNVEKLRVDRIQSWESVKEQAGQVKKRAVESHVLWLELESGEQEEDLLRDVQQCFRQKLISNAEKVNDHYQVMLQVNDFGELLPQLFSFGNHVRIVCTDGMEQENKFAKKCVAHIEKENSNVFYAYMRRNKDMKLFCRQNNELYNCVQETIWRSQELKLNFEPAQLFECAEKADFQKCYAKWRSKLDSNDRKTVTDNIKTISDEIIRMGNYMLDETWAEIIYILSAMVSDGTLDRPTSTAERYFLQAMLSQKGQFLFLKTTTRKQLQEALHLGANSEVQKSLEEINLGFTNHLREGAVQLDGTELVAMRTIRTAIRQKKWLQMGSDEFLFPEKIAYYVRQQRYMIIGWRYNPAKKTPEPLLQICKIVAFCSCRKSYRQGYRSARIFRRLIGYMKRY